VNLAARIAARASAGQVLVTRSVVETASSQDVIFVELGDVQLQGISRPVRVFEARRA
jgi:class 3 adenylate cyclase